MSTQSSIKTETLGLTFDSPLVLASGILGVTGASMNRAIENGCGAVTIKSLSPEPRTGHNNPTMIAGEHFVLNAVGLSNPGIEKGLDTIREYKELTSAPMIGSVFAGTKDEFVRIAEQICEAPINMLELDLSCPNVGNEFDDPFAYSAKAIEAITSETKERVNVPISIKLSPNVWNVAELAKAAEAAGADAITAVNTVSGMVINVEARRPVLHNRVGGISGKALFPIALKCVYDIYKSVKIPIIGTGGISSGEDALAMIMAGATLLGVGSAVYYGGPEVFGKINDEMIAFMQKEGITSLEDIRGAAHN